MPDAAADVLLGALHNRRQSRDDAYLSAQYSQGIVVKQLASQAEHARAIAEIERALHAMGVEIPPEQPLKAQNMPASAVI